ncbi:segregation/condensation protein A [Clostridia bacterium OttesenSCG-928-F22]|nr:segregation/condensation protein A [Clostridia bacterium OttesenSCG-928-F22]
MEYIFKLTDFEGPLDLLLHLIEKAKIDIKDIFVSSITEQYLAYLAEIEELDMEVASEFLNVAATLLLIKSRSLLPRPEPLEEEDPEMVLIRQIEEYRMFKAVGTKLKEFEEHAGHAYYKLPEEFPFAPQDIELDGVSADALMTAFIGVYSRIKEEQVEPVEREIVRDLYTIQNRIVHIKQEIAKRHTLAFHELFSRRVTRPEVVCVFAALLELLADGYVKAEQKKTFGEITITKAVS